MNKLTCDHEFDMNTQLLSNPPQFRCTKCRVTAFHDDVLEYVYKKKTDAAEPNKPDMSEFWKDAALASIRGENRIASAGSGLIPTAIKVADDLVTAYKERFI